MKKDYTALYLIDPYSKNTKSGFATVREAEIYIKSHTKRFRIKGLARPNWLVIETSALSKHLDNLDGKHMPLRYETQIKE